MLVYMCMYVSVRVVWYALLYTCMCVKTPNYVYRESRVEISGIFFCCFLQQSLPFFLSFFPFYLLDVYVCFL